MKKNNLITPVIFGISILILWELICLIFNVPIYLLPNPLSIINDFFSSFKELLGHVGITFLEAFLGFLIANIFAICIAVFVYFIPKSEGALMPFAIALKTTPIVAMAPLLILWFGTGIMPKVAAAAVISFFPALVNSLKGFNVIQENEQDLFRVYGASKFQILTKLRFNRAAPYIFSALKISSSLSIVGAIVGEFVGANEGIGYLILVSSYHLDTIKMFSALLASSIVGVLFYAVISYYDRKYVFWLADQIDVVRLESHPSKEGVK